MKSEIPCTIGLVLIILLAGLTLDDLTLKGATITIGALILSAGACFAWAIYLEHKNNKKK